MGLGGAGGWGWAYRGGKLSWQSLQHPAAASVGRSSVAAANDERERRGVEGGDDIGRTARRQPPGITTPSKPL